MFLRILLILLFYFSHHFQINAKDYIDSLETRIIMVDDAEKLLILDEIIPYYFRNEPLKAKRQAANMLNLAVQGKNLKYEIRAQRYVGLVTSHLISNHEQALEECRLAEKNAKSHGFIEELILIKNAFADIYHQIGNYTKSLEYQIEAYHLADSMELNHLISTALNNQARSYIKLNDIDKAEQCLKKSLKHAKIHGQKNIIAESNIVFGDLYAKRFSYQLALQHYRQAHDIYVFLGNDIQIAIAIFKIGERYFSMDQIDSAFQFHLKALAIRKRINDGTGLAESYNKVGLLCLENGEYQRAVNNLKLGLKNAEMINSNLLMQQSFDFLYQAYLSNNDFQKALYYQKKYSGISELIYAEADEKRIEQFKYRKEIELREREINSLEEFARRNKKQLATSRKFIFTLILLLTVTIISVVFIIRSYREKRSLNKKLQQINDQVVEQNKKLIALNSTKDKFFSIIGHDLKGPLNSLTSFSQLLINHTAFLTEEEIRTVARDLDKSLKNLYELLENLLGWARSQTGRIDFKPESFMIAHAIRENIQLLSNAALNKKIEIEMLVDENIKVFADLNSVQTVIRNLLSNAIKFTANGGFVNIYVDEWKDGIEIGIQDTGVGISREDQENIFDISAKHSTLGTNKEKGTGLGLILCKEFVERNHGGISIDSEIGGGTTFKFTLPKGNGNGSRQKGHIQYE